MIENVLNGYMRFKMYLVNGNFVYLIVSQFVQKLRGAYILAHLSPRLISELIYRTLMVRRPSVVHNFKHFLLSNRGANQSQILCGASLGRGSKSLFTASGSHDQDGCHAHIW